MDLAKQTILRLLTEDSSWWYGLDLVKASGSVLGPGTVYVYLAGLERCGLIESRYESGQNLQYPDQPRRRLYRRI